MSVILSLDGVTKAFGPRPLFADLTFDLRADDRVGLIGPNGAGKSTLLRILAGTEVTDDGRRSVRRGAKLGYLAQDDAFPAGLGVMDVIVAALAADPLEDHEKETRAAIALTQAGFDDFDKPASTLSGGWRKRLSVARELAREPDFLLLDEPTNHLDLPGVLWLEKLLRAAPFGYIVTTHDRAFLRAVADDILELSRVYPAGYFRAAGGFDAFADKKTAFLEAQDRQRDAVADRVRVETDWLGRKAAARTRKASSRIEAAHDRRAELAELNYRTAAAGAAGIDFAGTGRATKKLIAATGISKSLGGKPLFAGLDLILSPGMKLGLLGPNGGGKTTLLKVLSGELAPDSGTVTRADGLNAVTFEQARAGLDPLAPLRQALCPNGETVMFQGKPLHVAAWAQRFLFRPEQLDLPVGTLSGGEQARVRVAQLMLKAADVLFLDEPTNDLDIPALEVLEESLAEFPGALVLVSHDRDLMDRVCTEVIGLDGKGGSAPFGDVGQWLAAYTAASTPVVLKKTKPAADPAAGPKKAKLSYKEQQEFDGMEAKILRAEEDLAAKQAAVEAAATAPRAVLTAACDDMTAAQQRVEKLYARWQELEAKRG